MEVNKRDFVRQFSKYLNDGGTFCLTNKGEVEFTVVISKGLVPVLSDKLEIPKDLSDKLNDVCTQGHPLSNAVSGKITETERKEHQDWKNKYYGFVPVGQMPRDKEGYIKKDELSEMVGAL